MRQVLMSLLTVSLVVGCDGDSDKSGDDTSSEADDVVVHDDYHVFSVVADVPFEHFERHVDRGEESIPRCTDPPEGLTVGSSFEPAEHVKYAGTLAAGVYSFVVDLEHIVDGPSYYSTIGVTITAE